METLNKRNIIIGSHRLLMQKMDDAYTLDRLANDLRRSKKTLYHYFRSKDILFEAVFKRHQKHLNSQFNAINLGSESDVDKLIHIIYLIDASLKEIPESRWYEQAPKNNRIKEAYFELRQSIFERYLETAFMPYSHKLSFYGKSAIAITQFIITALEGNYFDESARIRQAAGSHLPADDLVFLLHGCLISLEQDV